MRIVCLFLSNVIAAHLLLFCERGRYTVPRVDLIGAIVGEECVSEDIDEGAEGGDRRCRCHVHERVLRLLGHLNRLIIY